MKLVSTARGDGCVDMRPHLPTDPVNFRTAILKDTEWYASLYDRIKARFDAWLRRVTGSDRAIPPSPMFVARASRCLW